MILLSLVVIGLVTGVTLIKIEESILAKSKRMLLDLLVVASIAAILWSLNLSITTRPINFLAADLGVILGLKVMDPRGPWWRLTRSRNQKWVQQRRSLWLAMRLGTAFRPCSPLTPRSSR